VVKTILQAGVHGAAGNTLGCDGCVCKVQDGSCPRRTRSSSGVKQERSFADRRSSRAGDLRAQHRAKFALDRLPKQLSFFKDKTRSEGHEPFNQTDLITQQIPGLPPLKDTIQGELDSVKSYVQ